MKFIFKRRFNHFDAVYLMLSATFTARGDWPVAICVVVVGAIISAVCETIWGDA